MRSFLLILLVSIVQLASSLLPLFGQSYLHEPTIWKQYFRYHSYPYYSTYEFTIELSGDTLVDGKVYFKTLKTGTLTVTNVEGQSHEYPIYEHTYPIREEDQKFYIYDKNFQQEILLHDFDLSIGDTAVAAHSCVNKIVAWIDTVYIGNIPRKQFYFYGNYQFVTLIEGVGSSRGLFDPPCNDWGAPFYIECYIQDQAYLQLHPNVDCSSLVSTENNNKADFAIYPNPFTEEFNIQFPLSFEQPLSVVVTNLLGSIVYQSLTDIPSSLESINLERIPAGIYIVWLKTKDAASSYKILKQ